MVVTCVHAPSDGPHLKELQRRLQESGAEGDRQQLLHILRVPELPLDWRALTAAAENGMLDVAERLIRTGRVDLGQQDREGATGLYDAAWRGLSGLVELILRQDNVDVNRRCCNGLTALTAACWRGRTQVVKILLGRKDIQVRTYIRYVGFAA